MAVCLLSAVRKQQRKQYNYHVDQSELLTRFWTDFTSSLWNFCRWGADVSHGETSLALRTEARRLFSRAKYCAVADPDVQIRGARSSRPWDKWEGGLKNIFRAFGPQFGLKIRGDQCPWAPPLDPPLIAYCFWFTQDTFKKWTLETFLRHLENYFGKDKANQAIERMDELLVTMLLLLEPSLLIYVTNLTAGKQSFRYALCAIVLNDC